MRWALSSLNYTKTIKTDTMVEAPYIFLCFPMPKVGSESSTNSIQILQMKSGSWRLTIGVLSKKPSIKLPFQRSPFTILNGIGIRPFETVREPGGSPWHLTPKNENLLLLVLKPSQPVISGSSKPGRWHFILGPLGRDRISQGEHLHSAQYREVVNCLYGPTSPGRARRHLCVKTLHPGGGKKNTKKIKREKYRIKWKLPTHLMD